MAFDQGYADALAEAATLRQELDDTKADLARLVDQLAEANGRNVDLEVRLAKTERARAEVGALKAELAQRPPKRIGCCRAAVDSDGFAHDHAEWYRDLQALRTAVRHVVDCYRHGNLMGVVVGVDKLAGLVDP